MKFGFFALGLLVLPATAGANQRAASACAARLSQPAQLVYYAAAPEARNAVSLRGLLKAKTTRLVRSGRLRRDQARPAAVAAYHCLKRLR